MNVTTIYIVKDWTQFGIRGAVAIIDPQTRMAAIKVASDKTVYFDASEYFFDDREAKRYCIEQSHKLKDERYDMICKLQAEIEMISRRSVQMTDFADWLDSPPKNLAVYKHPFDNPRFSCTVNVPR